MNTAYVAGATSKIVKIRGITISTGLPYTAGAFNTAGLSVQYIRDGGTVQSLTEVTATAGTYTSEGFVHAGGGIYEIGAPTAALAAGADGVVFFASGISDVLFSTCRVELMSGDPRAATVDISSASVDSIWDDDPDARAYPSAGARLAETWLFAQLVRDGFIIESSDVGSTGNDTTHIHLPDLTHADDTINDHLITILDTSTGRRYSRIISDWVNSTKLATVSEALPFTPDNTDYAVVIAAKAGATLDEAVVADAVLDELLSGHTTSGSLGKAIADLGTAVTTVDTVVDAVKAKTDNLPSDPADASVVAGLIAAVDAKIDVIDDFLDTEVAAIKAKTDSLTFTQAGHVDANIQRVNDVAVNGDGAGTPWGP